MADKPVGELEVLRQFYKDTKTTVDYILSLDVPLSSLLPHLKKSIEKVENVKCCGCWGRESR